MSSTFGNAVAVPQIERLTGRALHVRVRGDPASRAPAFPPRAISGPVGGGLVDALLEARACRALPETSSNIKLKTEKQPLLDEGFERAQRVASGRVELDDVAWLAKGFSAFLAGGGALSLERCLGLPRNDSALRRACRDYWLRRAWIALGDDLSPWRRSEKLASMLRNFRSRQWVCWRGLDDAPRLASEVEVALFQAFRSSERIPQTAMQLHNIANCRRHS